MFYYYVCTKEFVKMISITKRGGCAAGKMGNFGLRIFIYMVVSLCSRVLA